eukprot:5793600-Pyramimonas_sp.AAC.1
MMIAPCRAASVAAQSSRSKVPRRDHARLANGGGNGPVLAQADAFGWAAPVAQIFPNGCPRNPLHHA